jgi:crotonobetainyl-CoA:carnitine CoA-transferase CaiB-like acyl-CoA transferase
MTGALDGLTVIDASRVLAGPWCGQMLGDYGARVIKVEGASGDETRTFGAPLAGGSAPYFHALNRNKRSIVLDMNADAAREVFWSLIESADILIENFKASSLRNWGVDAPAKISEYYRRLIHCRITGFGDDGPLGGLPGYDAAVQAISGLMSVNGASDSGPVRLGVPVVDMAAGMQATIAILAALRERDRSGRGQRCDVSLYDCALAMAHPHFSNYLWTGQETPRTGNSHPNVAPYSAFETATCPVYIAIGNDRQFATLCRTLECARLKEEPRFLHNVDRVENREALEQLLAKRLRKHDGQQLAERLLAAGVPCAPVLSVADVASAAHTRHRDMVLEHEWYRGTGFPVKLSRTPGRLNSVSPRLGEHTREILLENGYQAESIDRMERAGAFGNHDETKDTNGS